MSQAGESKCHDKAAAPSLTGGNSFLDSEQRIIASKVIKRRVTFFSLID
jgi:hypothetical protein